MLRILLAIFLGFLPIQALAGRVGDEDRLPIAKYAEKNKIDIAVARKDFGASGRIMCPFNAASAFLVYKSNIVITARHNLFPEKQMGPRYAGRPSINRCGFEVTDGVTSTWYEVDVKSFVFPTDKQRSPRDRFDWVAMKLRSHVRDVTPYGISEQAVRDDEIRLVTIRQHEFPHDDWNERIVGSCKVRRIVDLDGVARSGLKTDCSANGGASGGAVLKKSATGYDVVGIHSSSPSKSCGKFSASYCFSWEVGLSDDIKAAIRKLAGE